MICFASLIDENYWFSSSIHLPPRLVYNFIKSPLFMQIQPRQVCNLAKPLRSEKAVLSI